MFVPMMTLILALLASDVWEYRPGIGFVNRETMERKTPQQFYEYGVALAKARKTDEALAVFDLLLRHVTDREIAENARFKKGETLWSGSRFGPAYTEFDDFLRLFPESPNAQKAKMLQMDSAFLIAQEGGEGFLGLFKSSKPGLDLLRAALLRFPREPFSSLYYYKMAKLLVEERNFEGAENELKFILSEYRETIEAPRAILLLGDIGLLKFDSVDYDTRGLADARRNFERFLAEADELSKISREAAAFVKENLAYAREKLGYLNETEAEKEYQTAEYYRKRGHDRSAKVYYNSILRHYPKTAWAVKARERLKELGP